MRRCCKPCSCPWESRAPSSKGTRSWKGSRSHYITHSHQIPTMPRKPFPQIAEAQQSCRSSSASLGLQGELEAALQPSPAGTTGLEQSGRVSSPQPEPCSEHTSSCTNHLWTTAKGALQASDSTAKAQRGMEQHFSSKNKLEGKEGSKIQVNYSMGIIRIAQTEPLLMCLALDNWVSFWHRVRSSKEKSQTIALIPPGGRSLRRGQDLSTVMQQHCQCYIQPLDGEKWPRTTEIFIWQLGAPAFH